MSRPLSGIKAAILAANGFSQADMTAAQKALIDAGANVRVVSPENGLVNGWDGEGWGHHFAVDSPLGSALGADYGILVIPGGRRSVDKLGLTAHTKRFISSFMAVSKPVIVMDDALHIMILTDSIRGRTVAGPEDMSDVALQAGAFWLDETVSFDDSLVTGPTAAPEKRAAFVDSVVKRLSEGVVAEDQAA